MATNKFMTLVAGVMQLVTGISTSVGAGDANKLMATNSTGKLDETFLPTGIGASTQLATVVEASGLVAGDLVNLVNNAGNTTVRKADNSNNRPAHGFVKSAFANSASATVYLDGQNTALTGLTAGTAYYLGTAGAATATASTASGTISQPLGIAINTTTLDYQYYQPTSIA